MQRIVVGIDGSQHARRALEWAVAEALLRGAELTALCVWQIPIPPDTITAPSPAYDVGTIEQTNTTMLDEMIDAVDTSHLAAPIKRLVVAGTPGRVLVEASAHADLVVVGARGHGGFVGLLLGSVSNQVAHHAQCPVVIVHDED